MFNFKKRRYIGNRTIVRLALLLTFTKEAEYVFWGRAAAYLTHAEDREQFAEAYSRAYLHGFSQMLRYACICVAINKPLLVVGGIASALALPALSLAHAFGV